MRKAFVLWNILVLSAMLVFCGFVNIKLLEMSRVLTPLRGWFGIALLVLLLLWNFIHVKNSMDFPPQIQNESEKLEEKLDEKLEKAESKIDGTPVTPSDGKGHDVKGPCD